MRDEHEKLAEAWNPIMNIDPQVEQATEELYEQNKEALEADAMLPWFLKEQAG